MSLKPFELTEENPVVEQFKFGLEAWEQPYPVPDVMGGLPMQVTTAPEEKFRRGVVKTRGGGRGHFPDVTLTDDEPAVKQFMDGLADWEHPFDGGKEKD